LGEDHQIIVQEALVEESQQCFYGETVGILGFRAWYKIVGERGHVMNAASYDFPVRIGFVDDPFDPAGFVDGSAGNRGWQLDSWVSAALQMQEDGVRAIAGGCGLTGLIQTTLQAEIDIPIYTSNMLFVDHFCRQHLGGKRVGILTVSEESLSAHNNILFKECGVSDDTSIAVAGMEENKHVAGWAALYSTSFDYEGAKACIVDAAQELIRQYPDIAGFLLECTEMPVFSDELRKATGLPVWDALDMVKYIHKKHSS
jgi:Asp/Glu/hydantoin racemase